MHGVFQFANGDRDIDHEQIGAGRGAQSPSTGLLPRRTTPRVPLGKICPVYG